MTTTGVVLGVSLLAAWFLAGSAKSKPTGDFMIAFAGVQEGQRGLFVMRSDGSAVRRLTRDALMVIRQGAWSPDGRRILFFPFRSSATPVSGAVPRPNLDMHVSPPFVIDADGQNEQGLSDQPVAPDCRWSRDSTRIVCSSGTELSEGVALYVFDVATHVRTRLTPGTTIDLMPDWSTDGKRIVFSSTRNRSQPFKRNLFLVGSDGARERQLTDGDAADVLPVWSPDGRSIAFVRAGVGGSNLFVTDTDWPRPRMLPTAYGSQPPAWTRDGRHVVCACPEGICLVDLAQGSARALISDDHPVDAVLAPDEAHVIYRSHDGPSWTTYSVDLRTHAKVKLTDDSEGGMFAVSPLLRR